MERVRQGDTDSRLVQPASHKLDTNGFDGFHDDDEDSEIDEDGLKKFMNALREDPRMALVSLA